MPPDFGPLLNGGLDLLPPGLPLPPKLGLGFHPGFPAGRWPGPESARGGRGATEPSPSSRRNGRLDGPPGLESNERFGAPEYGRLPLPPFHPEDEDLSVGAPGFFHPTDEDLSAGAPDFFHPTDEDLSVGAPDLLLGRAPPARGLPLLVVKGRARPPSPRNGRGEPGRSEPERSKLGRTELDRPPPERPAPARPKSGRDGGRGELGRSPPGRPA